MIPLVGRERELAALASHLPTGAGRGGAVAVIGEPGIGKTALVAAIADRARESGARVLWGRCSDLGARVEWEPLAQALGALLDEGVLDAALAARCGGGLLSILPDAAHLTTELAPPAGADPETIAFAVARATTRLMRHLCLQRPCVLVIDDVHDGDPASLRLLVRLAQEARTMALSIVMTAREAELGARRHTAELAELTRDLAIVRIGALDHAAGESLVRHVAPGLAPAIVERVLAAAEGNPLYLGELAAVIAARSTALGDDLPIPVGVKASIRARLDRLPPEPRAFVDALAVLGGHAPTARAAAIAGAPAGLAIELGVVVGSGADARLSHVLVRDVAYAELAPARRAALHRAAADEAATRGDPQAALDHVRHLSACGAVGEAIEAAIASAQAAILRAADDEAVSVLELASHGAEGPSVDDRQRAELAIALGRALLRCGRSEAGIAACARAATLAERVGDVDLVARAALAQGSVFRFGHVDRGLVGALARAVELRGPREDVLHARLLARLAAAEQPSLDPWQPIKRAHEAFALGRRLGDERVLLDVLHDGMAACVDYEDPHVRAVTNRELEALARRLRAPWYELRALGRLVFDHIESGEMAEADTVIETLDRVARSFAHPRHQWRVSMLRALRASSEGRWAAADRHIEEATALGIDDPALPVALFGHRFNRLRAQQRGDELRQLVEDEIEGGVFRQVSHSDTFLATMLAFALARIGELDRARALVSRARQGLRLEDVSFTVIFAETAALIGDRDECIAVKPALEKWSHRFASGGPMFMYVSEPAERALGVVVARLGDRDRGIEHLERALARLRDAGMLPFVASTALDLAALLDTGTPTERERAAALRAEAAELAERLDLVDLRARPAAPTTAPSVPTSPGFTLARDGDGWSVTSRGKTFRLRDSRGLRILARLVDNAGKELHALDLVDDADGTVDRGDAGEHLDARARAEYRARLVDLREDLADAERRGDLGWIERLRSEAEVIQAELSRAFDKSGRARRAGAAAERARSAVTRRVREAVAKIGEHDRELGEHLAWAVRTGMNCSYRLKSS